MVHNDPTQANFGKARRTAPNSSSTTSESTAAHFVADHSSADGDAGSAPTRDWADGASSPGATSGATEESGRPGRSDRGDAAGRGKLVMAAKVVEKIAARAASEVATAGGTTGGVLGIGAKTDLSARPKVDVHLFGQSATVDVSVAVAYPTSIRDATDRVRRHIIERVAALAGVQVTRVDIDVTAVHHTDAIPREYLR